MRYAANPDGIEAPEAETGGQQIGRREALRRIGYLLGGTLAAPTIAGVLGGCSASTESGWTPAAFTAEENDLVTVISERIIPETETPGAKAAKVNRFIDKLLAEWYPEEERDQFIAGLRVVNALSEERYGQAFLECTREEQMALLRELDEAAYAPEAARAGEASPFFRRMKELTLVGYYTSEIGATQELRWLPVPGRFDGCIPFEEVGSTWA